MPIQFLFEKIMPKGRLNLERYGVINYSVESDRANKEVSRAISGVERCFVTCQTPFLLQLF